MNLGVNAEALGVLDVNCVDPFPILINPLELLLLCQLLEMLFRLTFDQNYAVLVEDQEIKGWIF